jgi:hypothetical protein
MGTRRRPPGRLLHMYESSQPRQFIPNKLHRSQNLFDKSSDLQKLNDHIFHGNVVPDLRMRTALGMPVHGKLSSYYTAYPTEILGPISRDEHCGIVLQLTIDPTILRHPPVVQIRRIVGGRVRKGLLPDMHEEDRILYSEVLIQNIVIW